MRHIRIIGIFFFISLSLFWITGCQKDGGTSSPSSSTDARLAREHPKKPTAEVTIGGKVWNIDPTQSYQATGVWTNPNPRPLTEAEEKRREALPALIKTLETQRDELDKELRYLNVIEEPEMRVRFSFGKTPNFSPKGKPKIIQLGEFDMEIERPTKILSEPEDPQ